MAGKGGYTLYRDCYVEARRRIGVSELAAVGCYVFKWGRWSIQSNNRISPAKIKKGDIRLWLQIGGEGGGEGKDRWAHWSTMSALLLRRNHFRWISHPGRDL